MPGHTIHDLMELDVKVLWVQHLIDMEQYKEHQFALVCTGPRTRTVGWHHAILEQFQEVCPLMNTMDRTQTESPHCRRGALESAFEGFSVCSSTPSVLPHKNLIPLVAATNAVMVHAITREPRLRCCGIQPAADFGVVCLPVQATSVGTYMKTFRSSQTFVRQFGTAGRWHFWIMDFNFGIFRVGDSIGIGCIGLGLGHRSFPGCRVAVTRAGQVRCALRLRHLL